MAEINLGLVKFGGTPPWLVVNATDTYLLPNDGLTKLYVENSSSSALVIATIYEQRQCNYFHPITNFTFTCPNGGIVSRMGTFRKDRYNRDDGKLAVKFTLPGTGTVRACGVYDQSEDGRV